MIPWENTRITMITKITNWPIDSCLYSRLLIKLLLLHLIEFK